MVQNNLIIFIMLVLIIPPSPGPRSSLRSMRCCVKQPSEWARLHVCGLPSPEVDAAYDDGAGGGMAVMIPRPAKAKPKPRSVRSSEAEETLCLKLDQKMLF
jgi:hypothetical protein